jgi:hypothetical protein
MQTIKQLKEKFISDTELLLKDLKSFQTLSYDQLNWKPAADSWSIAECVDHLAVTNKLYLAEIEKQFAKEQIKTNCSVTLVKHRLISKFIIKSVSPNSIKKVRTFQVFMPSQSNYSEDVFSKLKEIQQSLINLISSYTDLNLNKYVMSSPAAKFVKENFCDVLEIIRLHDRRHFNQAQRVLNHPNFPKN